MAGFRFDFAAIAASIWPRWGLPCGACTRNGSYRCRGLPVLDRKTGKPRNGRCRMHGGWSTGPQTEVGKAAIGARNRRRAAALRPARTTTG